MSGPLTGVGVNQQVPIANALQQSANNSAGIREEEDVRAQEEVIQPVGAEAAEAQTTATDDQEAAVELRGEAQAFEITGNEERGSLVDVLV